jgi:phospholipid/cholesterol/gamma-HCH transport system substrate-binding protein
MSAEAHKFKVGLFVVGGVVLAAAALIWLGASKFLSETHRYVTYFNESVQGLDVGSTVKFMGVSVGTVTQIKIAPDGHLVETVMELKQDFHGTPDMRAELAMAGITGMKFVEIPRDPSATPVPITFPPDGDYIQAKASGTQEILTALGNVYEKLMQIDFQGISDETKATLKAINSRVSDEKVDRLIEGMAGAAERLRYLLSKKQTEQTIDEIEATLSDLKGLVHNIREEVAGVDLQGTFGELRETVSNFNQMLERVDNEFTATLINLRNTTANLSRITEKISQDPAQAILGEPPPPRNVDKEGSR